MVVGAGRGPLVSACLQCAMQADVPLKLYAVEKNPSAVNVLRILNRDIWQGQVLAMNTCILLGTSVARSRFVVAIS